MKLVKQASLWFSEGTSDKIYEVDLCEVGGGKFVVNFRYGRRGTTLKDGSKTPLPVAEDEARKVYDKLVASKTKEGYQEAGVFTNETTQLIDFEALNEMSLLSEVKNNTLEAYVLSCLKNAVKPISMQSEPIKWSLSRIIWRVGELRIREAVPVLISILPKSNALQQYTVCWALGRCGDELAMPMLKQMSKAAASAEATKRIAFLASLDLAKNDDLQALVEQLEEPLPESIIKLLKDKKAEDLHTALAKFEPFKAKIAHTLYLLSPIYPFLRESLKDIIKMIPFKGSNNFKYIRYIYKAAEFRDDYDMLAFVGALMEFKTPFYSSKTYYAQVENEWVNDVQKEVKKKDSKLGYSDKTRNYLIKRVWRTMRTLGESNKDEQYIHFATSYLNQFNDTHATDRRHTKQEFHHWHQDETTRNWSSTTTVREAMYKEWSNYLVFNQLLYKNSTRYELSKSGKAWQLKAGLTFDSPTPDAREEAYPLFWDAHPEALIALLKHNKCHPVHQFAAKALKNNAEALNKITYEDLTLILSQPYPETLALGLELAEKWYNPTNPNLNLALSLFHSNLLEARQLARDWVALTPQFYLNQLDFYSIALSQYSDNREWLMDFLKDKILSHDLIEKVFEQSFKHLQNIPNTEGGNAYALEVCPTFLATFQANLKTIDLSFVSTFLKHPLKALQIFGAELLLNHKTEPQNLPDGLIGDLINSDVSEIRGIGIALFGKLPTDILLRSTETLKAFCLAHFSEIRAAIRPVIKRLATENPAFGQNWVEEMLPYFRMKEHSEGLHEDLYLLFKESLSENLVHLDNETALKFLSSSKMPKQMFGQLLLQKVVKTGDLTMRQILRLADHDLVAVRQWTMNFYETNVPRIEYEAAEALRILDALWDDVRQWAFQYFRQTFTEQDWTPELLVFVCDSTRLDVQQFGKEMIAKFFKEENGADYLLKLSQHPSQNLQHFATHYLEEYAKDKPDYIEKLEHYFVTVLSQVNRSGVAKARIFHFLEEEGLKNEQIGAMIAKIMSRQSATMAVADKASCLRVMASLKRTYPEMEMAMKVKAVEKYQAKHKVAC